MSYTSDVYEYNIALFKNEEPEIFLQFLWNFGKSIEISGEISVVRTIQCQFTLLCGEALRKFEILSVHIGHTNNEN